LRSARGVSAVIVHIVPRAFPLLVAVENALAASLAKSAHPGLAGTFVVLQELQAVNGMEQLRIATIPIAPQERIKSARIFKGMVMLLARMAARFTAVAAAPLEPRIMVPKCLLLLQQCVLRLLPEKLVISSSASHLTSYSNVHSSQLSCYSLAALPVLFVGCFVCSCMCLVSINVSDVLPSILYDTQSLLKDIWAKLPVNDIVSLSWLFQASSSSLHKSINSKPSRGSWL